MSSVAFRDDTWGLSWSRRWHAIDRDYAPPGYIREKHAMSVCGSALYTQPEIRDARHLRHLKEVVADPAKSAGICKKCEKAVNKR